MCSMLPWLIPCDHIVSLLCSSPLEEDQALPSLSLLHAPKAPLIPPSVCSVALSLFIALKVIIDQIASALRLQP